MPYRFGGATQDELANVRPAPPDGDYLFVVTDLDLHEKEDDKTGTIKESLKVTLRLGDEYEEEKYRRWTRTVYLSMEQGNRGPLFEFLQACGYTTEQLSDPDFELEPAEVLNRRVQGRVKRQGDYDGQPNHRISRFRPEGFEEAKTAVATAGGSKRRGI